MTNFSEKTSFIIETFEKDRGELPTVSEEYNEIKAVLKEAVRCKIAYGQIDEQLGAALIGIGKQIFGTKARDLLVQAMKAKAAGSAGRAAAREAEEQAAKAAAEATAARAASRAASKGAREAEAAVTSAQTSGQPQRVIDALELAAQRAKAAVPPARKTAREAGAEATRIGDVATTARQSVDEPTQRARELLGLARERVGEPGSLQRTVTRAVSSAADAVDAAAPDAMKSGIRSVGRGIRDVWKLGTSPGISRLWTSGEPAKTATGRFLPTVPARMLTGAAWKYGGRPQYRTAALGGAAASAAELMGLGDSDTYDPGALVGGPERIASRLISLDPELDAVVDLKDWMMDRGISPAKALAGVATNPVTEPAIEYAVTKVTGDPKRYETLKDLPDIWSKRAKDFLSQTTSEVDRAVGNLANITPEEREEYLQRTRSMTRDERNVEAEKKFKEEEEILNYFGSPELSEKGQTQYSKEFKERIGRFPTKDEFGTEYRNYMQQLKREGQ